MLTVIPGETAFLATMYSFGAMLSFTIAHVSVIRLRQPKPETASAGGSRRSNVRVRGVEIPLTAVLGGLGTFGAFVVVMALDPVTLAVGGGWMVFGLLLYLAYRRYQGLPVTKTVKVVPAGAARRGGDRVPERARRLRRRRSRSPRTRSRRR